MVLRQKILNTAYSSMWENDKTPVQAQHVIPIETIKRILPKESGGKIIDLGCGNGNLLHMLDQLGYDVQGCEIAEGAIRYAKEKYDLEVKHIDLDNPSLALPYKTNEFDLSISVGPMESIVHVAPFLNEFTRIAKRGILVLPNYAFLAFRLQLLFKGGHNGYCLKEVSSNFITKNYIEEWFNTLNIKHTYLGATYPHGLKSFFLFPWAPQSKAFSSFEDNPHQEIPFSYKMCEKMLSLRPTLFGRFFIYLIEK